MIIFFLQNNNISELCRKHGIYESQFYQWKKDLLVLQAKFLETKRKKILKKGNLKMKLKDVDDKIDFTENAQ